MIADIKFNVDQLMAAAPLTNGQQYPMMSKYGALFTHNWKEQLAMAGYAYSLNLGTAGTELAGNAAIDADQPEFIVAVDSGWLIPMELNLGVSGDFDAEEGAQVLVVSDRTQAEAAGSTAAEGAADEVPLNLLDGGGSFGGRAWNTIANNLAAITEADILYAQSFKSVHLQVDASGTIAINAVINVDKVWHTPIFLAGPCMIVGYVVGTATATAYSGRLTFAHLPSNMVVTS